MSWEGFDDFLEFFLFMKFEERVRNERYRDICNMFGFLKVFEVII